MTMCRRDLRNGMNRCSTYVMSEDRRRDVDDGRQSLTMDGVDCKG